MHKLRVVMTNIKDVERVFKASTLREATKKNYIGCLHYAVSNGLDLSSIKKINEWISTTSNIKPSSKATVLSALKSYYKRIGENYKVSKLIIFVYTSTEKQTYLTIDEMNRMIKCCSDKELKLFMIILRDTGLRRGIAENLRMNTIDKKTGQIIIPENIFGNKAKKVFKVWLTKETLNCLLQYIKDNKIGPESKIFKFKWMYNRGIMCLKFRDVAKKAGIANWKHISPHIFRHSFATNFELSGGSLESLSYILGHKNVSSTQRYSHRREIKALSDLKKVRRKHD